MLIKKFNSHIAIIIFSVTSHLFILKGNSKICKITALKNFELYATRVRLIILSKLYN